MTLFPVGRLGYGLMGKEVSWMFRYRIVDILAKVQVFNGLTRDELKLISRHCVKMTFQRGDKVLRMGERSRALHILVKGELKVFLPDLISGQKVRRGSEVTLNILREGDYFGEYSIINKSFASASIVATQSGELLSLPEAEFNQLMVDNHIGKMVYCNMLRTLIKRLGEKEKELDLVLIAH